MNFRQCLYSVYSKHASYFLPSCSFSDHGLGFSLSQGFCLPGISFCSFVSFSAQSFPRLPEQIWLWRGRTVEFPGNGSFSFSSKYLLLSPCLTPEVGDSLLHFPGSSMWTLLWSPWANHCGWFPFISHVSVYLLVGTSLLSCASPNPFLPGFTLLLEQSVPGRSKFRGLF